ncbi:hypothetical protein, partial [Streptomyces rectiviolaceus]|uniref:hypothetical protein n=1 Tax=Streptomyces rectiviolaceus TaxID=332591 RepID=UPI0031D98978
MPQQQYAAASVRELAARVERVAPRDRERWPSREEVPGPAGGMQVQEERAGQLWMLVGMWDRASGLPESPLPRGRAAELFEPEALEAFWELAEQGQLRFHAKDIGKPLALATLRIVRDCLALLADVIVPGRAVALPVLDNVAPKKTVKKRHLGIVYRELVELAGQGPLEKGPIALSQDDRTRLLALVAVVLDAAPRSGELESMDVASLGEDGTTVQVLRAPQNQSLGYERVAARVGVSYSSVVRAMTEPDRISEALRQRILAEVAEMEGEPPVVERYALREGSQVALRRYLRMREALVEPLEGGKTALWVTIHPSKAGPRGIRMRADGIRLAYARGMRALNFVMAGTYKWSP